MGISELLDDLSKYGLTEVQAKTYFILLKLGKTSYSKIMPKMVDNFKSQASEDAIPSVLLIDDDRRAVKSLSHLLETNGYNVDTSGDGSDALKKTRQKEYQIALIDILLPDVVGTKLLKKIKKERPDIKEIIITGYPSIQNAIEALNEGADGYILKPFDPKDLLTRLKESLK